MRRHPASATPKSLNEGRGRDPGDTGSHSTTHLHRSPLNEGRGRDPGDTARRPSSYRRPGPLNEGRGRDPGDTPRGPKASSHRASLNEGRGRDPGAPLLRPRVVERSTKAGAETPATRLGLRGCRRQDGRSTKAGAETPATHAIADAQDGVTFRPCPSPLNEGRGRDPGDTPANSRIRPADRSERPLNEGRGRDPGDTRDASRADSPHLKPLNEGRGRDPGDTRRVRSMRLDGGHTRSTKAGAETPATQLAGPTSGIWQHAQRRPGPRPRRHAEPGLHPRDSKSLNEGRGRDPGDTANWREKPPWTQLGTDLATRGRDVVHLFGPCLGWTSWQVLRCPRNRRQVTTESQPTVESPRVRKCPVRATKARQARENRSCQTGFELPRCHS